MKQPYKILFSTIAFALFQWALWAQSPTINSSNFTLNIGQQFSYHPATYTAAMNGVSGANVTWNFASLADSGSFMANVVAPASTPYASSFPNANRTINIIEDGEPFFIYLNQSASATQNLGFASSFLQIPYTDAEDLLRYPVTLNSTWTDTYSYTINLVIFNFVTTGNMSYTVDGYGTLITPAGTFNNVLRIVKSGTETTTSDLGPPEVVNVMSYIYVRPGFGYALLVVDEVSEDGVPTPPSGDLVYINPGTVGIENTSSVGDAILMPNPVQDMMQIMITPQFAGQTQININDISGKRVLNLGSEMLNAGANLLTYDVAALAPGIYFVEMQQGNLRSTMKMVKK